MQKSAPGPAVSVAVVGAGGRGSSNARRVHRAGGRVVAVAEPDGTRRDRLADEHDVPTDRRFAGWAELAEQPRLADVAMITTQDRRHAEPSIRLAERGYHVLCEKPMAVSESDAARVVDAVEGAGVLYALFHSLRYTDYTSAIVETIKAGRIGRIVSVQHLEPVGWWHFAHSYVRGPWRRADLASPLLLAKSSHDLDWLVHVVGSPVSRVASFGRLTHFRPENRPAGAGTRCLDCAVEPECPYSAPRLYLSGMGEEGWDHWPLGAVTDDATPGGVLRALADGPYGRCVYDCDNDVVDHQVVALDFANGVTGTFTVTAFTEMALRHTRIFGTHGSIEGDGREITVRDFRRPPDATEERSTVGRPYAAVSAHDDGDQALVGSFLRAVADGDRSGIGTGPRESLAGHRTVWAAERARVTGSVVVAD